MWLCLFATCCDCQMSYMYGNPARYQECQGWRSCSELLKSLEILITFSTKSLWWWSFRITCLFLFYLGVMLVIFTDIWNHNTLIIGLLRWKGRSARELVYSSEALGDKIVYFLYGSECNASWSNETDLDKYIFSYFNVWSLIWHSLSSLP